MPKRIASSSLAIASAEIPRMTTRLKGQSVFGTIWESFKLELEIKEW
jgi:hypothetical protein